MPDALEITAETADGVIMGLQHKRYPVHGVQFHPESIASEHGHQLLANFLDLARVERRARRRRKEKRPVPSSPALAETARLRISRPALRKVARARPSARPKRPKPSS